MFSKLKENPSWSSESDVSFFFFEWLKPLLACCSAYHKSHSYLPCLPLPYFTGKQGAPSWRLWILPMSDAQRCNLLHTTAEAGLRLAEADITSLWLSRPEITIYLLCTHLQTPPPGSPTRMQKPRVSALHTGLQELEEPCNSFSKILSTRCTTIQQPFKKKTKKQQQTERKTCWIDCPSLCV